MNFIKKYREQIALSLVLLVAALSHAINMFHFPYYENDEGTYMSQAWSLVTSGELAPYTYWYDHAPLGWILIAIWVKATGGFFTFGTSVDSGRVLMFVLHIATSALLYFVTKRISKSTLASIIAVLVFSLSPLGIYFQRRVLLDNIMIFWVFVSLALLFVKNVSLKTIFLSGLAFGFAILTKENAVFFIPPFLYTIYVNAHKSHKPMALLGWLFITCAVTSYYFLYAIFKQEFLPQGFLGSTREHVSLLTTLGDQLERGSGLAFWNPKSDFYINFLQWQDKDAITIIAGIYASFSVVLLSIFKKEFRIPAFFLVFFWIFLLRGKLVIDFYIIPLLPFLGMAIGMYYAFVAQIISWKNSYIYGAYSVLGITAIVLLVASQSIHHYTRDETTPQRESIAWIKENVDPNSFIAIDASIYVDLHAERFDGDPVFPNADWVWKVEKDKEIYDRKLHSDWKNIEYVTASHEILKQIREGSFPTVRTAMNYSYPMEVWDKNTTAFINMDNYISTNGDWFAVYKVKQNIDIILDGSWNYYKKNFIVSYGQVIDPQTGFTTSEGQSYAMLRSVWEDDRGTFDGTWAWTKDHMQYRTSDKLFSWQWGIKNGKEELLDPASATDADTDIALALLFAYRRWGDEKYIAHAKAIISDIWEHEVVEVRGRYYVLSGSNAARKDAYLVNPSYVSPAAYRIFAKVDPTHDWNKVVNDSYLLLSETSRNGLPPNWLVIDNKTGQSKSLTPYVQNANAGDYGYDAFRTMWRIALDVNWFKAKEGEKYLNDISKFYEREIQSGGIQSIYSTKGDLRSGTQSLATNAGALSTLSVTNRRLADAFYKEHFEKHYVFEEGKWNDGKNYYDQNWAWFGTALYFDRLPNLYTTGFGQLAIK